MALDVSDEVGGGDGGADFEFGSAWGFAGEVGKETFHVCGFGRFFVHGYGTLRALRVGTNRLTVGRGDE